MILSFEMVPDLLETEKAALHTTRSSVVFTLAAFSAAQSPACLVMGWPISCGPTTGAFPTNSVALARYTIGTCNAHKPELGCLSLSDGDGPARSQKTESQLTTPAVHGLLAQVAENS